MAPETAEKPAQVSRYRIEPAMISAQHFIDPVAELKPPVLNRHHRRFDR